mgnify:CR=1 FL=1
MARPFKQMIGREFEIEDSGNEYIVHCRYVCPYCNAIASDYFTISKDNKEGEDLVKHGSFFENLECDSCGKRSDVRFHASMRR